MSHLLVRNGLLTGSVVNLSLGGLAIESTTALRIGHRYTFRLMRDDRRITIQGHIRWCRLGRTVTQEDGEVVAIFRAGFAFSEPHTPLLSEALVEGEWLEATLPAAR